MQVPFLALQTVIVLAGNKYRKAQENWSTLVGISPTKSRCYPSIQSFTWIWRCRQIQWHQHKILEEILKAIQSHSRLVVRNNIFSNRVINVWNSVPNNIVRALSINSFNSFPYNDTFWCPWETSLLKTLWEKEKLLVMSNFSFSHSVFFLFG